MLDLETEINIEVSTGTEETDRFYNELLNEVVKHDNIISDLYKLSLETDFSQGHNILEMDVPDRDVKGNKEFDILRPALKGMSEKAKTHFLAIFGLGNTSDEFFNLFFSQLGMLRIKKMNLIPKTEE